MDLRHNLSRHRVLSLWSAVAFIAASLALQSLGAAHADTGNAITVNVKPEVRVYDAIHGNGVLDFSGSEVDDIRDPTVTTGFPGLFGLDCAASLSLEKLDANGVWRVIGTQHAVRESDFEYWDIRSVDLHIPRYFHPADHARYEGSYRSNFSGCVKTSPDCYEFEGQPCTITLPPYISDPVDVTPAWLVSDRVRDFKNWTVSVKFDNWYKHKWKWFDVSSDYFTTNGKAIVQRKSGSAWVNVKRTNRSNLGFHRTPKTHTYRLYLPGWPPRGYLPTYSKTFRVE